MSTERRTILCLLFFFVAVNLPHSVRAQECNYVTLVKCFINILDEWAWTLYELKDNVVTISGAQCEHLRQLDICIQDSGDIKHKCQHSEVVAASNTVSDLLTHRKNSGSFLKSYYLLTYACSNEGQKVLADHRRCLNNEEIGEMTLSAGTYLSEKFLDTGDDDGACEAVNGKLQEYMKATHDLCSGEAAQVMCKSLRNMFKGLHADKLSDCEFVCQPEHGTEPDGSSEEDEEATPGGTSQQGGPSGAPIALPYSTAFFILGALLLLR